MTTKNRIGLLVLENNEDLDSCISQANESGHQFIVTPLTRPTFRRVLNEDGEMSKEEHEMWKNQPVFDREDVLVRSAALSQQIIGLLSSWIHLDSTHEDIRHCSEIALQQETQWATHIGLPGVLLHGLPRNGLYNTARAIQSCVLSMPNTKIIVRVPVVDRRNPQENLSWKRWNQFRTLIDYNPMVGIALELTSELPKDELLLKMWLAEPVLAVIVPAELFVSNKKGFPVLTKPIQHFLKMLMHKMDVEVILTTPKTKLHPSATATSYSDYINYLHRHLPELNYIERHAPAIFDFLQAPVQPMTQRLNDQIYQILETDVTKYRLYQQAVFQALSDFDQELIVIIIAGAGRGPLVNCCLNAAKEANRNIKVYAVENNPQAYVTLQNQKETNWKDNDVDIILSDIREWDSPEKCDILLSELLGSFGDNQLSPECLQGARHLLKPNGISIPASYSAYVCPLASSRLYSTTKAASQNESTYVVMLRKACELAESQRLWTFIHPKDKASSPLRFGQLKFKVSQDVVMHGFAGYFECTLYKDVILSTRPETKTPNLFTWFSLFFPIRHALQVPSGGTIIGNFWRLVGEGDSKQGKKTWYEWSVSVEADDHHQDIAIHNIGGRSFSMVHY